MKKEEEDVNFDASLVKGRERTFGRESSISSCSFMKASTARANARRVNWTETKKEEKDERAKRKRRTTR